jgi:alpha-amylase
MQTKHPLAFRALTQLVCACFLAVTIGFTWNIAPAKADVIYHAFDECFTNVIAKLPDIKAAGYTHVQISPANQTISRADDACTSDKYWYMQYQPLDYVLNGNLGTEQDVNNLISTAHKLGIKVIADVVLNHMAKYPNVIKEIQQKEGKIAPPFPEAFPTYPKKEYFHDAGCIKNYNDSYQVENRWLCDPGDGDYDGLPDLKTELPYVQEQEQNYLKKLLALGFDGLRFDAAKHIPIEDLKQILKVIPTGTLYYGEVIGESYDQSKKYIPAFPKVTDFQLLNTLKAAFNYGGDLRSLINPSDTKRALPGNEAVIFARNHDTWAPGQFDGWKFDDGDLPLATAYVLAIKEGTPLILNFDAFNPTVIAATQFHEKVKEQPQYYRNGHEIGYSADSANLLFIERGDKGLAIINKGGEKFNVTAAKMPGLSVGCYNELRYKFQMCVDYGGDGQKYINKWGSPDRGGIDIGPRTALFFVKAEA